MVIKKTATQISAFLLTIFFLGCATAQKLEQGSAKNRNICKELKGKVLVYMVFADTKKNNAWTDFDINSAFKAAGEAADWLMAEAKKNGVTMDIEIKYFQSGKTRTVTRDLPMGTVSRSLSFPTQTIGLMRMNSWANHIAGAAGKKVKFPGEVDNSIIKRPKDNVELIAKIRDIYRVDNVALIYLLNNNFTRDASVTLNTESDKKIEYAVASDKTSATLAKLILNLFGAPNLQPNPFNKKGFPEAINKYPADIMGMEKPELSKAGISPLTSYYIGWKEQPDSVISSLNRK